MKKKKWVRAKREVRERKERSVDGERGIIEREQTKKKYKGDWKEAKKVHSGEVKIEKGMEGKNKSGRE